MNFHGTWPALPLSLLFALTGIDSEGQDRVAFEGDLARFEQAFEEMEKASADLVIFLASLNPEGLAPEEVEEMFQAVSQKIRSLHERIDHFEDARITFWWDVNSDYYDYDEKEFPWPMGAGATAKAMNLYPRLVKFREMATIAFEAFRRSYEPLYALWKSFEDEWDKHEYLAPDRAAELTAKLLADFVEPDVLNSLVERARQDPHRFYDEVEDLLYRYFFYVDWPIQEMIHGQNSTLVFTIHKIRKNFLRLDVIGWFSRNAQSDLIDPEVIRETMSIERELMRARRRVQLKRIRGVPLTYEELILRPTR